MYKSSQQFRFRFLYNEVKRIRTELPNECSASFLACLLKSGGSVGRPPSKLLVICSSPVTATFVSLDLIPRVRAEEILSASVSDQVSAWLSFLRYQADGYIKIKRFRVTHLMEIKCNKSLDRIGLFRWHLKVHIYKVLYFLKYTCISPKIFCGAEIVHIPRLTNSGCYYNSNMSLIDKKKTSVTSVGIHSS